MSSEPAQWLLNDLAVRIGLHVRDLVRSTLLIAPSTLLRSLIA